MKTSLRQRIERVIDNYYDDNESPEDPQALTNAIMDEIKDFLEEIIN